MRSKGIFLVGLCMLVGCSTASEPTNAPTASLTETPKPTATDRATSTLAPTLTLRPTLGATPVFPALESDFLHLADFIFENEPPDCELPCWHGLVIGESDNTEMQAFFDEQLGFNGSLSFTKVNHLAPWAIIDVWTWEIPELFDTGYTWIFDEEIQEVVNIFFAVDRETNLIAGIAMAWSTLKHDVSLQQILAELGTPDWGYARVAPVITGEYSEIGVVLLYEQGIAFATHFVVPASGNESNDIATLCLADPTVMKIGNLYLMEEYSNGLQELTPLQQNLMDQEVETDYYPLKPLEDAFGMSEQELYDLATSQDTPCLELSFSSSSE